jgi:hypothetical protein
MNTRNGTLAVLTAALACAAPVAAQAAPANVKVRVEGKTKTIFEGSVTTDIHLVDGNDGTGGHKCDGTNGGAGTVAGPTATSALDDAVRDAGLSWKGSFDSSFEDFIVSQIGPDPATDTEFWGVAVQGKSLEVGGCQRVVSSGEEVLWAYDLFSKEHILRATGARKVRVGRIYTVKVTDTQAAVGGAISGALIGGKTTNSKGIVRLRFKTPGTKRLKATRDDSVRSNQLNVKVLKRK